MLYRRHIVVNIPATNINARSAAQYVHDSFAVVSKQIWREDTSLSDTSPDILPISLSPALVYNTLFLLFNIFSIETRSVSANKAKINQNAALHLKY